MAQTTIHTMLDNEAYTGAVVWGAKAKDGAPPVRVEDAHPAIISKGEFQRVKKLLGSRAPKRMNPRRASSPYLLSGLLRCETCGKAMTAAEAKSGKYTYYVCHSLLKRGSGTCKTPRLNAKSFEELIVTNIRENVLTESNIRDLVKLLDEEMDGVAAEQRERLETIEEELDEVKRRLGRIWQAIETTDIEMADASDRIREHRERKEKLEIAAEEARAILAERRVMLDSADTIATFAADMSEFLKTSELTETKAFVRSFVKEIEVRPGKAAIVYSRARGSAGTARVRPPTELGEARSVLRTSRLPADPDSPSLRRIERHGCVAAGCPFRRAALLRARRRAPACCPVGDVHDRLRTSCPIGTYLVTD